jgi:hypothetical protein
VNRSRESGYEYPCKICVDYSEYKKDKGEWVIEKIGIDEALGDFQKFVGDLINPYLCPRIDRVIYNDPAAIILWKDGTKTVVKCMEGEEYDPEKGFAMAVLKKLFGEDYGKVMKEFVKPELRKRERASEQATTFTFTGVVANSLKEAMEKMGLSGKEN